MAFMNKRKFIAGAVAAAALAGAGLAQAQEWPTKPITILVPQQAGTIQDMVARGLGDELSRLLKQPVVVENRPSASQIIAAGMLSRAAPDGHTLMVSAMPNVIAPSLLKAQPYKGNQDFTVISHSLAVSTVLAVSPQLPVNNLQEFIALLKANPGKYMFGSAGIGTPLHMALEQFNREAGTKSVHVPYKTFQMIIPDVSSNVVHYSFLPVSMGQLAKDGKIKLLGFNGPRRDPQLPDLPTLDELGLKGFDAGIHYFLIGPRGMPPQVVAKLNAAVNEIQAKEAYQARYRALGGITVPQNVSAATATARLQHEDERYMSLVKDGLIPLE